MLNGLDLFSGIGGLTLALDKWVKPIAYCENDRYAQGVLLSRMESGELPVAPISDDVTTLDGKQFKGEVDIISGGFPCQDISVAGKRVGLGGERSGLFFEIVRLAKEIQPTFIFLENVPNIRTKGLAEVGRTLADIGYDCRWGIVSAEEVGAPHLRKRWFLLGYSKHNGSSTTTERGSFDKAVQYNEEGQNQASEFTRASPSSMLAEELAAHATSLRLQQGTSEGADKEWQAVQYEELSNDSGERSSRDTVANTQSERAQGLRPSGEQESYSYAKEEILMRQGEGEFPANWQTEPDVGRVVDGVQNRVDRIKCLGNAVVPIQAEEAFKRLMGI